MNKMVLAGLVLALTASSAMAANALKGVAPVQERVSKWIVEGTKAGSVKGTPITSARVAAASSYLARMSKVDEPIFRSVLMMPAFEVVYVNKQGVSRKEMVTLLEIAEKIMSVDMKMKTEGFPGIAEAEAHIAALTKAVEVSAKFLGLFKSTSGQKSSSKISETEILEFEAMKKQAALIPEMLTKMNTADVESHTGAMENSVKIGVNPNVFGDQAFAAIMGKGNAKTPEEITAYKEKLEKFRKCD